MNFLRTITLALCAALLIGCTDNRPRIQSPLGDSEPPLLTLQFPSANAYTELTSITVRGTASDNEALANLTVNGSNPMTTDGYATWEMNFPLEVGSNNITIEATDASGLQSTKTINVVSQRSVIDRPFGSEYDVDSDSLYYVDINTYMIMRIDLVDGEVYEYADLAQFVPNNVADTPPLDLALDLASDSIYLTVASDDAAGNSSVGIWHFDTSTEAWSAFSDSSIDANAILQVPADVLMDRANNRLLVIDYAANAAVAVSLTDGSQSLLDANPAVPLAQPTDAVIDTQANRLLVVSRANDTVISIDLATGSHSLLTDNNIDADPAIREPLSIALDAANNQALMQDPISPGLIAVDLATGLRTEFAFDARGPINLRDARSLAIRGNEVLALDNQSDHLIAIDLDTEVRRLLSNNGFPRGTESLYLYDIAVRANEVLGRTSTAIVALAGSDGVNVLTTGLNANYLAISRDGTTAYAVEQSATSTSDDRISTIDLQSGNTQVISDGGLPDDTNPLDEVRGVAFDDSNGRIIVLTETQVLAVSLVDGSRTVLSNDITVPFINPGEIYIDEANDRILIVDYDYQSLISVDVQTGARSLFSTMPAPGDSSTEFPEYLAIGSDNQLWLYDQADRLMEIDATTGARTNRLDVSQLPRSQWHDIEVVDDVVYAAVDEGVVQFDLYTDERVVIYGSAPIGSGSQ